MAHSKKNLSAFGNASHGLSSFDERGFLVCDAMLCPLKFPCEVVRVGKPCGEVEAWRDEITAEQEQVGEGPEALALLAPIIHERVKLRLLDLREPKMARAAFLRTRAEIAGRVERGERRLAKVRKAAGARQYGKTKPEPKKGTPEFYDYWSITLHLARGFPGTSEEQSKLLDGDLATAEVLRERDPVWMAEFDDWCSKWGDPRPVIKKFLAQMKDTQNAKGRKDDAATLEHDH